MKYEDISMGSGNLWWAFFVILKKVQKQELIIVCLIVGIRKASGLFGMYTRVIHWCPFNNFNKNTTSHLNTYGYFQLCSFILSKLKNLHTGTPSLSDIDLFILNRKDKTFYIPFLFAALLLKPIRYKEGDTEVGTRSWWTIHWRWLAWSNSLCQNHIYLQPNERNPI